MKNRLIRTMLSVALTVCLMSNTVSAGELRTPEIEETHEAVTDNSKAEAMDVSAGDAVQEYTAEVPVVGAATGLTYTVEGDTVTITGEGECWTDESEIKNAIKNVKHVVFRDCKIQGSMNGSFLGCSNLESINLSGLDTSEVTDMSWMFDCSNLTSLDVSGFDTSQVTDMGGMFCNCSNLISLDVSGFDTSQVTSMSGMFVNCSGLTSLDVSGFDTSQVISMSSMFFGCSNLTSLDVSDFDTSQVTNMGWMFYSCNNLTGLDLSSFDLSKVSAEDEGLQKMLTGCSLKELRTPKTLPAGCNIALNKIYKNPNGVKTEAITPEFAGTTLTALELAYMVEGDTVTITGEGECWTGESEIKTAIKNAKQVVFRDCKIQGSMSYAFGGCSNLESINLSGLETSEVTNMNSMFSGCSNLTSLDVSDFDTSQVTNMGWMFYSCNNLTGLDLSNFDLSKVSAEDEGLQKMLTGCSLKELRTPRTLPAGCNIALNKIYKNPNGVKTEAITPEFAGTTLTALELAYMVEGDTVTITGEGTCWTFGSEIQKAISNAKHIVFRDCKIQGDMSNIFSGCSNLESVNLSGLDTSEVVDMNGMFYNCSNLTSLDVSGLDTAQVMNMNGMFCNCSNLTSLNVSGFDTSQVTDMSWMFYNCSNLTSLDVSGFDTSQVTNMQRMFQNCSGLTSLDVSGFDTSQVTNMDSMFERCMNLTSLDVSNFDTSQVTNMGAMFFNCIRLTSLDVSGFNTSQVKTMNQMFGSCMQLTSLNVSGFDTSQVIDMTGMFGNCSNLTSLGVSGFDTSKVRYMGSMFNSCSALTSLDLSSFDLSKVPAEDEGFQKMLVGCSLKELRTPKALPAGCSIPLGHDYQTPAEVITDTLTPELAGTTLILYIPPVDEQFTDVQPGAWYVSAVQYAYDNGIMTGKTATNFAPNANLTRAEFTTVLYSQAGKPAVTYQPIFKDVEQGAWYSSPVLWAYDEEIVSGYTNGCFGTSDKITREQLALMMYKYAQTKGYDTTSDADILSSFSDEAAISNWARGAMQWAASHGIVSGKGKGADGKPMLDPKGNATRAECAAMIKKLLTME